MTVSVIIVGMVVGTVVAVMEVVCCDMFVELNHCNCMAIAYRI